MSDDANNHDARSDRARSSDSGADRLPPTAPLAEIADADCATLRARLAGAGYTDEVIRFAEGIGPGQFDPLRLPLVRRALERRGDAAALLARLFAYDDAVEREAVGAAIGDDSLELLLAAGALAIDARDGTRIVSRFRLMPIEGLWILSDGMNAEPECVMGPGPTTLQILGLLPERIAGSVLDVGCGAGSMALVATRRGAARAVGTDINPRAIEIARFNARLNGLAAEFLQGDLVEPVRGERFPLVVAQPPYIVHPATTARVAYLHGGPAGDEIAVRLVGEIPAVLAPAGLALVLTESAVRPRAGLHERLRGALAGAPVDLVVLAAPAASPSIQAIAYASLEAPDFGEAYAAAARRYRDHIDSLGIAEFVHALVVLRAGADGTPPGRQFTAQIPIRGIPMKAPGAVLALFAALDFASLDDDALSAAAVRAPAGARWVEERSRPDPRLEPSYSVRFAPGALPVDQEMTGATVALVAALDASASVGEAIARYATECGATPAEVRHSVLDFVREGLSRGTLEPRAAGEATAR